MTAASHNTGRNPLVGAAILAAMVLLFAVYVLFNLQKIAYINAEYGALLAGAPAPAVTLKLDGERLARFRLPSSGIFDAGGSRQIHFERLDDATFERLRKGFEAAEVYMNGARLDVRKGGGKEFLAVIFEDWKIYLVGEDDTKVIAGLLYNENRNARDVLFCRGDALCPEIRLAWTGGVSPLRGPFLDTDLLPQRRGMPRGRWMGSNASFVIASETTREVTLLITALLPRGSEFVSVAGSSVQTQEVTAGQRRVIVGGKTFLLGRLHADIDVQQGNNPVTIKVRSASSARNAKDNAQAYIVKAQISSKYKTMQEESPED